MTFTMADSIYPSGMPKGWDAYAGYVNGNWPTFSSLPGLFPGARYLSITVNAAGSADCLDIENGDATPAQAPGWVRASSVTRPVLYCSVSTMQTVLSALQDAGIGRSSVRLWSAHYGAGEHICGPSTCGLIDVPVDGTQWASLTAYDASILSDSFFSAKEPDMIILSVTASGTTTTYLYSPGQTPQHIVSGQDQAAFAAALPVVAITQAQYDLLAGQS